MGFDARHALKILIKILNVVNYIEFNIQNIKTPRTNNPII